MSYEHSEGKQIVAWSLRDGDSISYGPPVGLMYTCLHYSETTSVIILTNVVENPLASTIFTQFCQLHVNPLKPSVIIYSYTSSV